MSTQAIRTAVLKMLIINGMSVREFNELKKQYKVTREQANNLFFVADLISTVSQAQLN